MSLAKLKRFTIPEAGQDFTAEAVNGVTALLNAGEVSINDVSSHFGVDPNIIIQSLTGSDPSAFTQNTGTMADAEAMNRLVSSGVASIQDVANFYSAPPEFVEEIFTNGFNYSPAQMDNARQGVSINTGVTSTNFETPETQADPRTGLAGSEQALTGGVTAAINALNASNAQNNAMLQAQYNQGLGVATDQAQIARDDITSSTAEGIAAMRAAQGTATGNLNTNYQAGLASAENQANVARQDIMDNTQLGLNAFGAGTDQARTDISGAFGRAEGMFDPFRQAGQNALGMQQALSGSLGQEAFDQAYNESPQMAFLREQGMRANLAGAGATGGLGGGNVQKELQRFGQGLASQGLQQQISNLSQLSGQGLNATGSAASTAMSGGTNLANLASSQGQAGLQSFSNQGSNLANIASGLGSQQLNTQTSLGNNLANINVAGGQAEMQGLTNAGGNRANIASALGGQALGTSTGLGNALFQNNANSADLVSRFNNNLGINLATGRTNAGNNIAAGETNTANNLATSFENEAANTRGIINAQRNMLVEMVDGGFIDEAAAQTRFGEMLAQSEMSRGNAQAGVPFTPFVNPNYAQGIGNALDAAALGSKLAGGGDNQGGQNYSPVQVPSFRDIFN